MENNQIIKTNNYKKVFIVKDGEEVNLETVSVFEKPFEEGEVVIKAVVLGSGKLNLRGVIKIKKGADGVNAFLRQNVLIIGDKAQVRAEPILEIETDEVKASHAATIGKVDDEQMFYLMSKGLSQSQAQEEIIKAFLRD